MFSGSAMDKHSSYPGESLLTTPPMEDPLCGRSVGLTTVMSPAAGSTKRRAVVHCLAWKPGLARRGGLGGFMLKAHSG